MAFTELSEEQLDSLRQKLTRILATEQKIAESTRQGSVAEEGLRDHINSVLKKAKEIVAEFEPKEFTIGVGLSFPPSISASFTWDK